MCTRNRASPHHSGVGWAKWTIYRCVGSPMRLYPIYRRYVLRSGSRFVSYTAVWGGPWDLWCRVSYGIVSSVPDVSTGLGLRFFSYFDVVGYRTYGTLVLPDLLNCNQYTNGTNCCYVEFCQSFW